MSLFGSTVLSGLSYGCMAIGIWFWLWGTWPLLGDRSVLYKLHGLSVSDTLGSMLIIAGLLLKIPREWPLLILALISLAIWNTVLGYVLAYCSAADGEFVEQSAFAQLLESSVSGDGFGSGSISPDLSGEESHDG